MERKITNKPWNSEVLVETKTGILESRKGVYFDGSNTINRIFDVLEEKRPKIICIDELDKMPKQFQDKLLNFMENYLPS